MPLCLSVWMFACPRLSLSACLFIVCVGFRLFMSVFQWHPSLSNWLRASSRLYLFVSVSVSSPSSLCMPVCLSPSLPVSFYLSVPAPASVSATTFLSLSACVCFPAYVSLSPNACLYHRLSARVSLVSLSVWIWLSLVVVNFSLRSGRTLEKS